MGIYSPATARSNSILSRLRTLLVFQRFSHTVPEGRGQSQLHSDVGSLPGTIESSSWRVLDTRKVGIDRGKIPVSPSIVLHILKQKGFDAYLVGGCVRDLLLHKVPKDYDVITTAKLSEIRKMFHHCVIVGRRFPICQVHIKGSVVEVSSFETVAKQDKGKEECMLPQVPVGCELGDLLRWTNCMHRDFTVNSLFFNPLANRVYDYTNALSDLCSKKLRTLIPAELSFQEDCARILRGLRLAARLNFSFAKETENAIHRLGSSILSLAKSRILMELNYMLSYGAAAPSLLLLHRFHLLDMLLPIQAAHLTKEASETSGRRSLMLMELFSSLDHLASCDRPAHSCLWVSLFAFHQALIMNPQQTLVVLTFASVLYHGKWVEGVQFARCHAKSMHMYAPEISDCVDPISDDELGEKVSQFGEQVRDSVNALTESSDLQVTMRNFPGFACSGLVFVSKNLGKEAKQIFQVMHQEVTSLNIKRKNPEIKCDSLGKGNREARFVLGEIIINTLVPGILQQEVAKQEMTHLHVLDFQERIDTHARIHPAVGDWRKHNLPTKKDRITMKQAAESEEVQKVSENQKLLVNHTNISEKGRNSNDKEVGDIQSSYSRELLNLFEDRSYRETNEKCYGASCGAPRFALKKDAKKTQEKVDYHQSSQQEIRTMLKNFPWNKSDLSEDDQNSFDPRDRGMAGKDFLKILDESSDDERKPNKKCHALRDISLEQPAVDVSNVCEIDESKKTPKKVNRDENKKSSQVQLSHFF